MDSEWPCKEPGCKSPATFAHVDYQPSGSQHVAAWCDEHKLVHKKRILLSQQQGLTEVKAPPKKTPEQYLADAAFTVIKTLREMGTQEAQRQLDRLLAELEK